MKLLLVERKLKKIFIKCFNKKTAGVLYEFFYQLFIFYNFIDKTTDFIKFKKWKG